MTLEQAKQLVGRTFTRDGKSRAVVRIEGLRIGSTGTPIGYVYWGRTAATVRTKPQWLPDFIDWVSKAYEVQQFDQLRLVSE